MPNGAKRYTSAESAPTRRFLQHAVKPAVFYPVHNHRLRRMDADYTAADCLCFVTFNVQSGCGVAFAGADGDVAWRTVCATLDSIGCQVYALCLMPDHAHLLVAPTGNGESVSDIVRRIKSQCYCALRQNGQPNLKWQPSFHDHILTPSERAEDIFHAIIAYIHQNPERAGLSLPYPYLR